MDCDKCQRPAIVYQRYSGMHLCTRHFQEDCEKKAKKAIRKHSWIHPGDRIGIAMSGGAHSTALAHFLSSLLLKRRDIDLVALTIDEGIAHYRDPARPRDTARSLGIPWYMTSFREVSGVTMDEIMQQKGEPGTCSRCRQIRTHGLTGLAAKHGVTRIAFGQNLDDCAGSVLWNILKGKPGRPLMQEVPGDPAIPVMTPFIDIPEREVVLYASLHRSGYQPGFCPYSHDSFRAGIATRLNEYSYHHPATRYALVHLGEELMKHNGPSGYNGRNVPENGDLVVSECMSGRRPGELPHGI
jgi:tRNA(Ile)-lysidine synthase TilS/MesJ